MNILVLICASCQRVGVYGTRERVSSSVGVIGRAHEAAGGTARQGHRTALHAAPTLTCM